MELLREAPVYAAKMACYFCLNPENVVDTGMQIEGEGVLVICRNHAHEIAVAADVVQDPNADAELEQMASLVERLSSQVDRTERLNHRLQSEVRGSREKASGLRSEKNEVLARVAELEAEAVELRAQAQRSIGLQEEVADLGRQLRKANAHVPVEA